MKRLTVVGEATTFDTDKLRSTKCEMSTFELIS